MRIGVFFGGISSEREVSFRGGKAILQSLDRSLFTPIPIFVDSVGNFILLNSSMLSHVSIRDFYPVPDLMPDNGFRPYIESLKHVHDSDINQHIQHIGRRLLPTDFVGLMDFAFIAMHGVCAEDGVLQGLLEWYQIPYSGSGLIGSAIGIDKILQNKLMQLMNGQTKKYVSITRKDWGNQNQQTLFQYIKNQVGLPMVLKAPRQGSSLGVKIVRTSDFELFRTALNTCFSILEIKKGQWVCLEQTRKVAFINQLLDITEGVGMPVFVDDNPTRIIACPHELMRILDTQFAISDQNIFLTALSGEHEVLIEEFVEGREFTCLVIVNDDGVSVPLVPTEVVKQENIDFDYKAKYNNGNAVEEKIVMEASDDIIGRIQHQVKSVFDALGLEVYARIDGFVTKNQEILIHDPNTIPGMTPASFLFRQMSEIGLNSTQTLTFLIRNSVAQRIKTTPKGLLFQKILEKLDQSINQFSTDLQQKVVLFFGGFAQNQNAIYQHHVREIYQRLNASAMFYPIPVYVYGTRDRLKFQIITTRLMYRDSIQDLANQLGGEKESFVTHTLMNHQQTTRRYAVAQEEEPKCISLHQLLQHTDYAWFADSELQNTVRKNNEQQKIKLFDDAVLNKE